MLGRPPRLGPFFHQHILHALLALFLPLAHEAVEFLFVKPIGKHVLPVVSIQVFLSFFLNFLTGDLLFLSENFGLFELCQLLWVLDENLVLNFVCAVIELAQELEELAVAVFGVVAVGEDIDHGVCGGLDALALFSRLSSNIFFYFFNFNLRFFLDGLHLLHRVLHRHMHGHHRPARVEHLPAHGSGGIDLFRLRLRHRRGWGGVPQLV